MDADEIKDFALEHCKDLAVTWRMLAAVRDYEQTLKDKPHPVFLTLDGLDPIAPYVGPKWSIGAGVYERLRSMATSTGTAILTAKQHNSTYKILTD